MALRLSKAMEYIYQIKSMTVLCLPQAMEKKKVPMTLCLPQAMEKKEKMPMTMCSVVMSIPAASIPK